MVPAIPLKMHDLKGFTRTIILHSWVHSPNESEVFNVPPKLIEFMEEVSSAAEKKRRQCFSEEGNLLCEVSSLLQERDRQRSRIDEMNRWIERITAAMEQSNLLQLFYKIVTRVYEFPEPFIARAVSISDIENGMVYVLQGLSNDKWITLLHQKYSEKEIGIHAFKNDVGCRVYRLVCLDESTTVTPTIKLYKAPDDINASFHKAVPLLTAACQDGYAVQASSVDSAPWEAINAFNDNPANAWASANTEPSTLQITLCRKRVINAVELVARSDAYANLAPKDFRIEGSLDKVHWVTLLTSTQKPWNLGEKRVLSFDNDTGFLSYRVFITSNQGGGCHSLSFCNIGNKASYAGDPVKVTIQ